MLSSAGYQVTRDRSYLDAIFTRTADQEHRVFYESVRPAALLPGMPRPKLAWGVAPYPSIVTE